MSSRPTSRSEGRRIEGLPLFDGGTTDAAGVSAPLGAEGVHLAIADRAAIGTEGEFLAAARRGGQVTAIVVVTSTSVPGLVPSNARVFAAPYGCPVLQVGSESRACSRRRRDPAPRRGWSAARRARSTTAVNVVAEVPGRRPRSRRWSSSRRAAAGGRARPNAAAVSSAGWRRCGRWRVRRPARRTMFVASSGHELGHLGLDAFLHAERGAARAAPTPGSTSAPTSAPAAPRRPARCCRPHTTRSTT